MEEQHGTTACHATTYEDDRRARELFHYFQPDNPALLPSSRPRAAGLTDPSSISRKASPNLVLTALVQLAAIKLGVQRAIISLIDRETLYVVAEASKSLNLGNNDIYEDDGDGLWMGCSHGPMAGTLCEKTITLKPTPEDRYPLFVVKDLRQHPVYNNIPCVCGPPYFRYYAGTPLTTSNGITIGSLYVIDPRPDITLTPSHVGTLGAIADAVMEYLETSRQSLESHRLAKVLSGLNSFVQGDNGEETPTTTFKHDNNSERASSRVSNPQESPKQGVYDWNLHATSETSSLRSASPGTNVDTTDNMLGNNHSTDLSRSPKLANSELPGVSSAKPRGNKTISTFQRAANLMRESLDLGQDGGVVIFDSSEHSELDLLNDSDQEQERKSASVCALSAKGPIFEDLSTASLSPIATQLDLHFARRMLRRYPRGGLWYFYQDGTAFSSDDDAVSSGSENAVSSSTTLSQRSVHPRSIGTLREKDLQTLRKYFPQATRIIFAPLWDSFNSRWFGGCFCWSAVETRVFSAHVELGGVFGFGSSLMVEHSRVQSQESDRKKGDFISSISHELRSPLHGILAATDFLSEHVESEFAKSLLDTVRACGQTLLDTFEQILDYSKINSFDTKRHSSRLRIDRGRNEKARSESLRILKVVHVAAVVEDVIESVYSGHIFSTSLASGAWRLDPGENQRGALRGNNATSVDVLIDIAPHDWEFLIEPGALRRIIMNVFGNALKYTREGFVSVRVEFQKKSTALDSLASSESPGTETLVLTVSDTGKGISNEYLHSNIFTPFSQEDSLSPGTGLGLSLVRSILRSLNGTIKIKSQVGLGTVVKITLPLTRPQNYGASSPPSFPGNSLLRGSADVVGKLKRKMAWKTLSVLTPRDEESHNPSSLHIIRDYLTEWFGLRLQSWDSAIRSDLILVKESELDMLPKSLDQSFVLVLCQRGTELRSIRAGDGSSARLIQVILPCGPYRLARTLLEAIENANRDTTSTLDKISQDLSQVILHENGPQPASPQVATTSYIANGSESVKRSVPEPDSATQANVSKPLEGSPRSELQRSDMASKDTTETGVRILLVEDNPINMALLKRFVNRKQPQILHAAVNGRFAVEQVQKTTEGYHYIFMDMSMPVMDGFEATKAIRSIERNRGTTHPATIIALTGLGSSEHIAKAYAAGINVFLTKPVSFNDIERLMDERNNSAQVEDQDKTLL